ncbi:MAG: copper homeostasis protein CutC [Roseibium sp.]
MTRVPLEICVDTIEGARTAADNGADRIELCAALSEGGLTPSFGLMTAAADLPVPVYAMIRPRAGDFRFSDAEKDLILQDIAAVKRAGLKGIVIGAVDDHARLDRDFLADALSQAELPATLHRAIDTVADFDLAIETAITLGFERVLTSGQAHSAACGLEQLARAVDLAAGRMSIMAGSGVTAENAVGLLKQASVSELHASCSVRIKAHTPDLGEARLGFVPEAGIRKTDGNLVRALRLAMNRFEEAAA